MSDDTREHILQAALQRAFPKLSAQSARMLAKAIIKFVEKALLRRWNFEQEFGLGVVGLDRTTPLSRALRQLREQARMTPEMVCRETQWSVSKLSRVESGDVGISATDVMALLRIYGSDDTQTRQRMQELLRRDRESRRRRSA